MRAARCVPAAPVSGLILVLLLASPLTAATAIEFDTPPTVACRDITSEAFEAMYPGERQWEARFRISTLIRDGDAEQLLQFLLTIEDPGRRLRVADYQPRTTLGSELAGNVAVHKHDETTNSLGLAVTGSVDPIGKLTGNGSRGSKNALDVRYELLPPQHLVSSSGTIARGTGAYFKLKPTPQSTLEGGKEFVIVFRAPQGWRAGRVLVRCEAVAVTRGVNPLINERVTRREEFLVTLFAGGDREAKQAAGAVAAAELALREAATRHHQAIRKRAVPSPLHQVGMMLALTDAKIPADWLQRLIARPTQGRKVDLLRLPEQVRDAATNYVSAVRRVEQW